MSVDRAYDLARELHVWHPEKRCQEHHVLMPEWMRDALLAEIERLHVWEGTAATLAEHLGETAARLRSLELAIPIVTDRRYDAESAIAHAAMVKEDEES